ncbi:hypothetical protein B0F90DRAFT_1816159 [Multifurca ochricompacta]|uniref:DUF6699 domain-containing protein n=1 Tax=Multifurca ochricompacta TaxID=376703 RepID=A0AAD4M764_9AGAM|nr:hypothetical protein B0F90DRAFT_1816159 [Multifurca ochricompacta]
MPDSEPATPFIPPRPDIGSPAGNSPAVLPSVVPMSPSQSSTLSPNAFYSPYTGTPFIPSPMAPPGSYYLPTVQLPDGAPLPPLHHAPGHPPSSQSHPSGVSADWIGPTTGLQPTAYATPYPSHAGLAPSPWAGPMSTPFAGFGAFAPPLPPTNPPGSYAPHPTAHLPQGYGVPYATPAPQFAIPHGYPMAYATPAWVPAPMAYPPPGPPPPAAPPRQPERLTRAERYDKIGHFAAGPHYGPVLEPLLIKAVGATLQINPLLLPVGDDEERAHLRWNMLFSTAHCHRSTDPSHRSWSNGRQEPATFPRLTELRLISQVAPWILDIHATSPAIGVTCGDVIEQLSEHLQKRLRKEDYEGASGVKRRAIRDAYHHNRSRNAGVPGGQLGDGLKALDWLGIHTMFGGVQLNENFVLDRFNVVIPCMLELVCVERPLIGEEDEEDGAARGNIVGICPRLVLQVVRMATPHQGLEVHKVAARRPRIHALRDDLILISFSS